MTILILLIIICLIFGVYSVAFSLAVILLLCIFNKSDKNGDDEDYSGDGAWN